MFRADGQFSIELVPMEGCHGYTIDILYIKYNIHN